MTTIIEPHPRTQWMQPFAELMAAIRRTNDPLFTFEVVQSPRMTEIASQVGWMTQVMAIKAAGFGNG